MWEGVLAWLVGEVLNRMITPGLVRDILLSAFVVTALIWWLLTRRAMREKMSPLLHHSLGASLVFAGSYAVIGLGVWLFYSSVLKKDWPIVNSESPGFHEA